MGAFRAGAIFVALLWLSRGAAVRAQQPAAGATCPTAFAKVSLEQGVDLCARTIRQAAPNVWAADGDVTIALRKAGARLQADTITVENGIATASGNVLVVWGDNRMAGTSMVYEIESGNGTIENAIGQVEPEFFFFAKRVHKYGADRVRLESATITTCTQPVPYWSFSVSTAHVRLDHYARMRNVRLRAKKVPVVYLPYLVWPVKPERAAGLLFPDFGSTNTRGNTYRQAVFLPLGPSADLTVFGEYYTRAGWGGGGEFRMIPNREGRLDLSGFYIDDKVSGAARWRGSYQQTQNFLNGFRMVADVTQVSDFAFYSDFERSLAVVSSPTILGRLEFSRNGSWTSINVRELRREQLFSDQTSLVQQTLPEIEWRGRSRRLGRTPFYFSYESSVASIQQRSTRIDADYERADVFPTLTAPWSPRSWIDINPSVNFRLTHWTQSQAPIVDASAPVDVREDGITRAVAGGGVEIVGPKIFRIVEKPGNEFSTRYKHTIEPRIVYARQQSYDRSDEILSYDDVDRFIGSVDQLQYGLRSRLFAQRPRSSPEPPKGEGEKVLVPEGETGRVREAAATSSESASTEDAFHPAPREPVEIASFEISQRRSFDTNLSSADRDGDGTRETVSHRSPVSLTGRLNPSPTTTLDLRGSYDVLYDRFSNLSLSGGFRNDRLRSTFSLVYQPGLTPGVEDRTQMVFTSGVALFDKRVRVALEGTWDPQASAGASRFPEQLWRVEYYLQCCGFLAEYLRRDFTGFERRDFRFTIDLRGIGKLIDWRGNTQP